MSDLVPFEDPFLVKSPVDAVTAVSIDDFFPDTWDPAQKSKGVTELGVKDGRVSSGLNRIIPRDCDSKDCVTNCRGLCPLSEKPEGSQCPYERALLETYMRGYFNELKPAPDELGTISLIRALADVELRIIRVQGELANAEHLIEKDIFDQQGNIIATEILENPLLGVRGRFHKEKLEIMKQLANTRADRQKNSEDASTDIHRVAEVMSRISRLMRENEEIDGALEYQAEEDKFSGWFDKQKAKETVVEPIDADYEVIEDSESAE
jgi:hypothetical protein